MHGEPGSAHRYAPDGLVGDVLEELINRAYAEVAKAPRPTSALVNGTAAEQRRRRMQRWALAAVIRALSVSRAASGPDEREVARSTAFGRRIPRSLGSAGPATWARPPVPPEPQPAADAGMAPVDVRDTRPGGPNRQERAHRVGAPESLSKAIEEIGMLQVRTCVSVHCDQCGDSPGEPGFEAHWPAEDTALDAAAAQGWVVGPGGRLWCSACGPVLTCESQGHEFSQWRHPNTPEGRPAASEYRHCRRCCLHDSRPTALGQVA